MYKPSILVVDDEPNNFDVIEAILSDQDYEFYYAPSGEDAIAALDILKPDLILLDVMMPKMDGIAVCKEIRASIDWKHLPIIMVTALSTKEDLARCLEAGANDFISKPLNRLECSARVKSMLRIKQQHDRLQRSNALINAQLEASLEGVIAADEQGRLVAYNQKFCRMWNVIPFSANGENTEQLLFPLIKEAKFSEELSTILEAAYDTPNYISSGEIFLEDRVYEYFNSAVTSPTGKFWGVVWRFRDVSDRKKYEQELKDAKEAAESALRVKSDFLAMMSHEIRTPINGVLGMTQLLSTTPLGIEQQKYLHAIQTSGELLLAVINDILDFSKLESGKLTLEQIPTNLHQLAADICALLSQQAEAKGILLSLQIDKGVAPFILGDSIRLRQILLNLANNAVKFTDSGRVEVKISLQSSETLPLLFSVSDTGIGISTEALQRLFQPFTQASIATARKYGGTGLGLAICQKLIQMMGGEIWAESSPDIGSTFSFALPMLLAEAIPEDDVDSSAPLNLQTDFAQQFPHRILVAEDNPINQELISAMLGKMGYAPEIVGDGLEAIDALKMVPYTLLFLDVQMPRMNGLETANHISLHWQEIATDRTRPTIIAMTASAMQGDREMCLEAGMDDYISKPIFFDALQRMISCWSKKSSAIPLVSQESIISQELTGSFDPNTLSQLSQYSPDLPKRMIRIFLSQEAPHLLEILQQAIKSRDVAQIEFAAHSLKGSSSMFGTISFSQQCHEIEVAGRKHQLDGIELLFDRLEDGYKLVTEYLEAFLHELIE